MAKSINELLTKLKTIREEELQVPPAPPKESGIAGVGGQNSGISTLDTGGENSTDDELTLGTDGPENLAPVANLSPAGDKDKPLDDFKDVVLDTALALTEADEENFDGSGDDDDEDEFGDDGLGDAEPQGEDPVGGAPEDGEGGDTGADPAEEAPSDDDFSADSLEGGEGGDDIDSLLDGIGDVLKGAIDHPELSVQIGVNQGGAAAGAEPDGDELPPDDGTDELPPDDGPGDEPPAAPPEPGSEEDYGEDQEAMESFLKCADPEDDEEESTSNKMTEADMDDTASTESCPEDLTDIITQVDQLKFGDPKVNSLLMKFRDGIEKIKSYLAKHDDEDKQPSNQFTPAY